MRRNVSHRQLARRKEPKSAHVPLKRESNLRPKRDAAERKRGEKGKQRDALTKGDKNIIGCGALVRRSTTDAN